MKEVKAIIQVKEIYSGKAALKEAFAEIVAQSLQMQSGKVWTRSQQNSILKLSTVKS